MAAGRQVADGPPGLLVPVEVQVAQFRAGIREKLLSRQRRVEVVKILPA